MKRLSATRSSVSERGSDGRGVRAANGASRSGKIVAAPELETGRPRVRLDGVWEFFYDPKDIGVKQRWFDERKRLGEKTRVPGTPHAERHPSAGPAAQVNWTPPSHRNRRGFEAKTEPAALQAGLKYPSLAPAWHIQRFKAPSNWRGKSIWLHFGGVTPAADFWLNGVSLGSTLSSRTPLRCDVSRLVHFGEENIVSVRVHWPPGPRLDGIWEAGEFSPFAGIYRSVWIESAHSTHVAAMHVIPGISPPSAEVRFDLSSEAKQRPNLRIRCTIEGEGGERFQIEQAATSGSLRIAMPGAKLWSPQQPALYRATLELIEGEDVTDAASTCFGLREIRVEGHTILLNGKPVFLRGGCDDHYYPRSISPPASKAFFLKRLKLAREYGFNYTKSCVDVFTPEFLEAADEVGLMVCQEMPFGLSGKYRVDAREKAPPAFERLWQRELENIIRADRNHPCVIAYSMCSELGTNTQSKRSFELFSREFPARARELNPVALAVDITHGGEAQFSIDTRYGPRDTDLYVQTVQTVPTVPDHDQTRLEPLRSPITPADPGLQQLKRPWILHEYAWWTQLPDPKLIPRYDGLPQKLNGPPETLGNARKNGLGKLVPTMVRSSRHLKYAIRKDGLELARRFRQAGGYHLWLIHDFSYAPEGVFNEFWDRPSDLSSKAFVQYNDDTVLLLEDGNRRCFESGQPTDLGMRISHFGSSPLEPGEIRWQLLQGRSVSGEGTVKTPALELGVLTEPLSLQITMPARESGSKAYTLAVSLQQGGQTIASNQWKLWSLPEPRGRLGSGIVTNLPEVRERFPDVAELDDTTLPGARLAVTSFIDEQLMQYLLSGGRVVLLSEDALCAYRPKGLEFGNGFRDLYRSVPWNAGVHGNMGTIAKQHPALSGLPHEGWCDFNFVHLIAGVYPLDLEVYRPTRLDPIIRSIGHHRSMADKAYLFEARVGKGSLIATSLKIRFTLGTHIESRALLDGLLRYASGSRVRPLNHLPPAKLRAALSGMNAFRFPVRWRFRTDPTDAGVREKWHESDGRADWVPIYTDRPWTNQGQDYHGVAWYSTPFTLLEYYTDEFAKHRSKLVVRFAAIDGYADVYLDGRRIGAQKKAPEKMWSTSFDVKLPRDLDLTATHRLDVRVKKDYLAAGIWRPVTIQAALSPQA